jgi:hypothetical protein
MQQLRARQKESSEMQTSGRKKAQGVQECRAGKKGTLNMETSKDILEQKKMWRNLKAKWEKI